MKRILGITLAIAALLCGTVLQAADQYFAGDGSALNDSKWGSSSSGPFADVFTAGNVANFATVNGTGTGPSSVFTVGGINATENFTITSISSTIANQANGVVTISVSSGKTLDFSTQPFTSSGTAGYIKNGDGILALSGNTYGGGFTLNAGTVIARGVNAMGGNTPPGSLTINGGAIGANATRDFSGKYSGIIIGGDFQLGVLASAVSIASDTANLTFNTNMLLGAATRKITIGANGTYTLGGIISGDAGVGLTVTALSGASGKLTLTNANTYTGKTTVSSGSLSFNTIGNVNGGNSALGAPTSVANGTIALGGSANLLYTGADASSDRVINMTGHGVVRNIGTGSLTLSGGITGTDGNLTLRGNQNITVSGAILIGTVRWLIKTDAGTLTLSNPANDFGILFIAYGTVSVNSIANNGTASAAGKGPSDNANSIQLGQNSSTSSALGTLSFTGDSGGSSDRTIQINNGALGGSGAIENTVAGQTLTLSGNVTALSNASASALILTGAGNGALSGNITGTPNMSLIKAGAGTWAVSGANTYTGGTTVSNGTLLVNGSLAAGSAVTVTSGGTLGGTGTVNGTVSVSGTLDPGASVGTLTLKGNVSFASGATNNVDISGANCDVIDLGGTATLTITSGAILKPGTLVSGNSYVIASNINGAVTGTFKDTSGNSLTDNSELPLQPGWFIHYVSDGTASRILLNQEAAHYPNGNTFTGWPAANAWNALSGLNDVNNSVNTKFDFVGDSTDPCGYWAQNSSYVFFRMRVQVGTVTSTTYDGTGTLYVYIDTNSDSIPDFAFAWDKKNNLPAHGLECTKINSVPTLWSDVKMNDVDTSQGQRYTEDFNGIDGTERSGDGYVRSVDGQSTTTFGTTTFIDFAVSWNYLRNSSTTGLNIGQTWRIAFGSDASRDDNNNAASTDIAGGATPISSISSGWSSSITPTPVVLLQLGALTQNGKVTVRWSTSSESKTAGFDLYRLIDGQWVKLNDALIPSQGWPNGGIGANYSVLDPTAQPGQTYSYKLVERTTDGQSIEYGPYERTVSPFVTTSFEMTPNGFKLKWLSRTGEKYRVLKRTNLTSGQYEPIAENIAATPPENEYVDPVTTGAAFYRIELQP